MTYPISSHCLAFQHDEDGGYVIEASTIQDPIAFATTLRDEDGPDSGAQRLVEARAEVPPLERRARDGRTTRTTASVVVDENGMERFDVDFNEREVGRIDAALEFSKDILSAAGATQLAGPASPRPTSRAACRMGDDPERSAIDRNGKVHGVSAYTSATAR